jgi:predicted TIM-barrel fold metal-dependent hydrolase
MQLHDHDPTRWLISADDHIIEPPGLWLTRVPKQYHGSCPQVREDDRGEAWFFDGKRIEVGGNVVWAGVPETEVDPRAVRYADMPDATYDASARVALMNDQGVLASIPFPSMPRFCGQEFSECRDRELGLTCIRAYNDFMIDEWNAASPARMIANILIPFWDPVLAAKEIDRMAERGARGVCFSENFAALGWPSIHRSYWDPVFDACVANEMPLSVHVGSSSKIPTTGRDAPALLASVTTNSLASMTFLDFALSPVFVKHPRLRVTLSEGGIGWVPYTLSQLDRNVRHYDYFNRFEMQFRDMLDVDFIERAQASKMWPHGDKRARDVYKEFFRGCFIADSHALSRETIDAVGSDCFIAEADYPHLDSTYPNTLKQLDDLLEGLTDEDQHRLRQANGAEWYRLDLAAMVREVESHGGS